MKKFLQEPWFFWKTNTSPKLHSAEGRITWGMLWFSPSHSILGGPWKGHTPPRLHQTFALHHPPLEWKQRPPGSQDKAELHNTTLDLRREFSDHWGQGKPFMWLCWVMTGLLLLLILINICWHLLYNQRDEFFTRSCFTFPSQCLNPQTEAGQIIYTYQRQHYAS